MKFQEIPLFDAVMTVRGQMISGNEDPGAAVWDTTEDGRKEVTQRVLTELIKDTDQTIIDAWIKTRKSPTLDSGMKKIELLVEVSRVHGVKCFYANRAKGECSEDVHVDRIIPGSRGGQYTLANCVLACGRHNTMRGDLSVEQFLIQQCQSTVSPAITQGDAP